MLEFNDKQNYSGIIALTSTQQSLHLEWSQQGNVCEKLRSQRSKLRANIATSHQQEKLLGLCEKPLLRSDSNMASPYGPSLGLISLLAIWLVVASLTATVAGSESTDPYVTLGCWRDTADRAIPTLEGTDPRLDNRYYPARQNPIEKCYLVAFDRGFRVFAVQDDGACMGSADAHNTYKKYGPSTACAADGEGGPWANEVYQITANVPEETTTFVNGTSETAPPTDVSNTTTAPVQHETVASVTSAVPEATIMTASRAQTGEPISTKASITSAAEDEGSESVDPYVSLGCWRDTADRAIPVLEGTDPRLDNRYYPARQNPIEKCYLVAFDRGFRVFAVQDDGQCFGSANAHNTYKKYGPSTACAADGEGGPWANEVYQITAPFEDICLGTTTCDRSAGASCRAWGDPHYISFDGTRTDFMGTCTYTLAERTEEPAFRVAAKNEHRYGRTHVSYISRVTVEVYAHRITVSRNNRVSVRRTPIFIFLALKDSRDYHQSFLIT
ncbi:uncharacterized protein LOC118409712 [Branchiostoma floridae]|uniref:Uncharacterized protein LOC118409712 n=1 Tax=Branchiostoma floridae TaxID=7739 RepID=A0A9J7KMR7_BRAFL|nr:uncharacterized protein LOC118409712 [Branchiostoma floridae]